MEDQGDFKRKMHCVATAWEILETNPDWKPILEHYSLGFSYAWLAYAKHGTLNKTGKIQVLDTYDFLLKSLKIPEDDYYNFYDMLVCCNRLYPEGNF